MGPFLAVLMMWRDIQPFHIVTGASWMVRIKHGASVVSSQQKVSPTTSSNARTDTVCWGHVATTAVGLIPTPSSSEAALFLQPLVEVASPSFKLQAWEGLDWGQLP